MALEATVVKAELQLSDLDRHHYAAYPLTLAQHPSETDQRLVVRLVAFALFASERLEFGKDLSNEEEPDLWRRDYTGQIDTLIQDGELQWMGDTGTVVVHARMRQAPTTHAS
jgi:uncharacterized protein YaeQ